MRLSCSVVYPICYFLIKKVKDNETTLVPRIGTRCLSYSGGVHRPVGTLITNQWYLIKKLIFSILHLQGNNLPVNCEQRRNYLTHNVSIQGYNKITNDCRTNLIELFVIMRNIFFSHIFWKYLLHLSVGSLVATAAVA